MKEVTQVSLICLGIVVTIGLYGSYRCTHPDYNDILMKNLNIMDLNGWSITHLITFFFLGYYYPNQFIISMMFGIGWEALEHWMGKSRPAVLGGFGNCITDTKDWWFGRLSDIIINFVGFMIGVWIH